MASNGAFKLFRSVLFTPADLTKAFEKVLKGSADCIIFDLEDSVHPDKKAQARDSLFQFLSSHKSSDHNGAKELVVRVNCPISTVWGNEDLKMVHALSSTPTAILLPKVNNLPQLDETIRIGFKTESSKTTSTSNGEKSTKDSPLKYCETSLIPIWAMVETALGVIHAESIASSPSVTALVFGSNDLTKELKAKHTLTREPLLYAMSKTINAARAYNKYVIDGVHLDIQDNDGLRMSCVQGRNLGFDGKSLIHPSQVEITNECFSPSEAEILLAKRIVTAYDEAMASGKGVCTVDGKMVEYLHVCNAHYILDTTKLIRGRE